MHAFMVPKVVVRTTYSPVEKNLLKSLAQASMWYEASLDCLRNRPWLQWIILTFVLWKLAWLLIYWVTGLHLSYISINNGVSFNKLTLKHKKFELRASSVRLRLWGNSQRVIFLDLKIVIHDSKKTAKSKRKPLQDRPLSVYPKSFLGKKIVNLLVWVMPSADIELKYTDVVHLKLLASLDTLRLQLTHHHSFHEKKMHRFHAVLSGREILACPTRERTTSTPPIKYWAFTLHNTFAIDTESGVLRDVVLRAHVEDAEINVFNWLKHVYQNPEPHESRKSSRSLQETTDILTVLHHRFAESFREFSFNLNNLEIKGIPLLPPSASCDLSEYLEKTSPEHSVSLTMKAFSFHFGRVGQGASGFEVIFNKLTDKPLELTCSILLLKLHLVGEKCDPETQRVYLESDEFFCIPNTNVTFKSNITHNLAEGLGLKSSVVELFLSASSPLLDVDTEQLGLLIYNVFAFVKLMKLRKLRDRTQRGADSDGDDEVTKIEMSDPEDLTLDHDSDDPFTSNSSVQQFLDRAITLLNDYYPMINLTLTWEQPRLVIRSASPEPNISLLFMLSYSTMLLQVVTSPHNDYDANCHFIHPCMTYQESSVSGGRTHEEFLGLSEANITCKVYRNLRAKAAITLGAVSVSLCKPQVLNGINTLIRRATADVSRDLRDGKISKFYDSQIVEERERAPTRIQPKRRDTQTAKRDLLTHLPHWLVSATLSCSEINIELGSTSPLVPSELIEKLTDTGAGKTADTVHAVSMGLSTFILEITGDQPPEAANSSPSSSQVTLATTGEDTEYWAVSTLARKLHLSIKDQEGEDKTIFDVPTAHSKLAAQSKNQNKQVMFTLNYDDVNGLIDRHAIFVLLGSVHLFNQTILEPINMLKANFKRHISSMQLTQDSSSLPNIAKLITFKVHLKNVNLIVGLAEDFKVKIQSFGTEFGYQDSIITVKNEFTRLLADSPLVKGYWNRLLCVDAFSLVFNDPSRKELVHIVTPLIRIIQPHRFVVYKLFDNLSVFLKIVKHLVKCMKLEKKETIVHPNESKPLDVPNIRMIAEKLTFSIEDDPLESELSMIFQLGQIEQRKRCEIFDVLEERALSLNMSEEEYEEALFKAQRTVEMLWIRKVSVFKSLLAEEIVAHKEYLFGKELSVPESENRKVVSYVRQAPLLHVVISHMNLCLSSPSFPLEELPNFIYNYGQMVPKDTRYNLMIPTYIDAAFGETVMHLRDFPLPLLHLPRSLDKSGIGKALKMKGNLIISEALTLDPEHLRKLEVQLTKVTKRPDMQPNKFDKLIIEKTLATVKLYTDLEVKFDSESPSRFVWGTSYQFGIQQIMLNVDQFSKPPVDPSPKLGFWDKLRLTLHGKCTISTGKKASIEVAFKGGRDPYNLFPNGSGFILKFLDHVVWDINKNDDLLHFFDVKSQRVAWYIPNYLSSPLLSWTRDSSEAVYFPSSKRIMSSCHGYYLLKSEIPKGLHKLDIEEKTVIELSGGVSFTLGFLLQRKLKEKITNECKPHYDVQLFNPEVTKDGHDSYSGFRSSRIHMAISLIAHTENSYNTIHLTPGSFKQFFSWWKIFQGNMMLPVRRGRLFGEAKRAAKFSEILYTNKFLFRIKSLFISHIYRDDGFDQKDDKVECVGLRGKVDSFLVDLHQRKEERITSHEELSKHTKVMKMNFNLGEVALTKIDLRAVRSVFVRELYKSNSNAKPRNCKYVVFDRDYQWFDESDFDEAFAPNLRGQAKVQKCFPLLYTDKFAYIRDTSDMKDSYDWGNEETHDCWLHSTDIYTSQAESFKKRLDALVSMNETVSSDDLDRRIEALKHEIKRCEMQKHSRKASITTLEEPGSDESFHNRFLLVSMFFIWNEEVRNCFMKYIHLVTLNKDLRKYLSYEFVTLFDKLIETNDIASSNSSRSEQNSSFEEAQNNLQEVLNQFDSSIDRLNNFDKIIRKAKPNEKVLEDYKIEVISPQIQLHSKSSPDSVVMITAPSLESKFCSVVPKRENSAMINAKELEVRYGAILKNANVMVLDRNAVRSSGSILECKPYGTSTTWPPFLGIEVCTKSSLSESNLRLVENMSFMFTFDKVLALGSNMDQIENADTSSSKNTTQDDNCVNRLRIDVPELAITCTSKQYFTLYATVLGLLMYTEPMSKGMSEKLSKLKFSIDFQDFNAMSERIKRLHRYLNATDLLLNNYRFRQRGQVDNETLNEYLLLGSECENTSMDIYLLILSLFAGDIFANSSSQVLETWRIAADKIVVHMLQDDYVPILDLKLESGRCKRFVKEDGSNDNRIEIRRIECINLLETAYFGNFLEPLGLIGKKDMISVDWSMNRKVGGIRVLEYFDISSLPLNVKIDETTGKALMKFIFQTDPETQDIEEESPVVKVTGAIQAPEKESESTSRANSPTDESDLGEGSPSSDDLALESTEDENEDEDKDENTEGRSRRASVPHLKELQRKRRESVSDKKKKRKTSFKDLSLSSGSENNGFENDVDEMISRSKQFISVVNFTSRSFKLMISLRLNSGAKRFLNVTNFLLTLPEWQIEGTVLSMLDIAVKFKKLIISTLMRHSGQLLKNKLSTRLKNAGLMKHRLKAIQSGTTEPET